MQKCRAVVCEIGLFLCMVATCNQNFNLIKISCFRRVVWINKKFNSMWHQKMQNIIALK